LSVLAVAPFKINAEYPIAGEMVYTPLEGKSETMAVTRANVHGRSKSKRTVKIDADSPIFNKGKGGSLAFDVKFSVCTDSICKIEQASKHCAGK